MNRILVIQDNQTLADELVQKLSNKLNCEVDVAYKLSEAKLFLKMYQYFIVVTDINLPDAPNGVVVDYLVEKKAHTIVLTSNTDKALRKSALNKKVIDYVIKNDTDDFSQIISTIRRLQKNQTHKVLVVDDSMVFRKQMQNMLQNLFINVYTVAHGEEALGMLQTHPDISLVLTDYNMPVMDGMELTIELRKTHKKANLSIIAISSNEENEINSEFLKNGANDYIKKPFSNEEFSCRVNNALEAIENINTIKNSDRDFLTGLYNKKYFHKHINNFVKETLDNNSIFSISLIGIDAKDVKESVTIDMSEIIRTSIHRKNLVALFDTDEFCIVIKDTSRDETNNILASILQEAQTSGHNVSIGIALYEDEAEGVDGTLSQADMMLYKAKQNGSNQIVFE